MIVLVADARSGGPICIAREPVKARRAPDSSHRVLLKGVNKQAEDGQDRFERPPGMAAAVLSRLPMRLGGRLLRRRLLYLLALDGH